MSAFAEFIASLFASGTEIAALWPLEKGIPFKLHNTLTNKLEPVEPLTPGKIKMYNCGPTPYDRQHIGNMVPPLLADLTRRSLEAWGYKVEQVMNITDFGHLTGDNLGDPNIGDDKMMRGLKNEGLTPTLENMRTLAEKYAKIFFDDISALNVDISKVKYPRASDYIPQQIDLIKKLEAKGYAYVISDGVYYDTAKFKEYGKLGNINLEGQKEGIRVEENSEKKNPRDFVLWKKSARSDNRMGWDSPWGFGFPGWHIECTAMIFKLLGEQIDIHTGGIEHIPIHHNNEIAQAEAVSGKQYVKYWLHNEHITIEGKKISKSLGNTVYVSDLVERGLSPLALRYWFYTGHYRTPTNFTWDSLAGADQALKRLKNAYQEMQKGEINTDFLEKFYEAIANDLDTARGIALIWENLKNLNRVTLDEVDKILNLSISQVEKVKVPQSVKDLVSKREAARKSKDFAQSDALRAQIEQAGFMVKDTQEGPKISKK